MGVFDEIKQEGLNMILILLALFGFLFFFWLYQISSWLAVAVGVIMVAIFYGGAYLWQHGGW